MRLTRENARLYVDDYVKKEAQTSVNHRKYVDMYNKLADLEDIEDELGIDLITLFKAINGFGFWSIYGFEKIEECEINFSLKCFMTEDFNDIYFKDYGKTWALTKEELEK